MRNVLKTTNIKFFYRHIKCAACLKPLTQSYASQESMDNDKFKPACSYDCDFKLGQAKPRPPKISKAVNYAIQALEKGLKDAVKQNLVIDKEEIK